MPRGIISPSPSGLRKRRQQLKRGFYGRLKQGVYPLPAPLGYVDQGAGKPKTIDPVAGPLLRWAFQRYATGSVSVADLAAELQQRGIRPRRGTKMSQQTLSGIL